MLNFFTTLLILSSTVFSETTTIPKLNDTEVRSLIDAPNTQQTKVINFWATWCAPCVKELHLFENLNQNKNYDVKLLSLDFSSAYPDKLTQFILKKNIQSQVFWINSTNINQLITHIHKDWSGAIPATLVIFPSGKTKFHEGQLTEESLKKLIQP